MIEPLRKRLKAKLRKLDDLIDKESTGKTTHNLRRRFVIRAVQATARTSDHVIGRIRQIIWIGNDAHFFVQVQNRSNAPHRIKGVELIAGKRNRVGTISFPDPAEDRLLAVIAPKKEQTGVITLPNASRWKDDTVTLILHEQSSSKRTLRLKAVLRQ